MEKINEIELPDIKIENLNKFWVNYDIILTNTQIKIRNSQQPSLDVVGVEPDSIRITVKGFNCWFISDVEIISKTFIHDIQNSAKLNFFLDRMDIEIELKLQDLALMF